MDVNFSASNLSQTGTIDRANEWITRQGRAVVSLVSEGNDGIAIQRTARGNVAGDNSYSEKQTRKQSKKGREEGPAPSHT